MSRPPAIARFTKEHDTNESGQCQQSDEGGSRVRPRYLTRRFVGAEGAPDEDVVP